MSGGRVAVLDILAVLPSLGLERMNHALVADGFVLQPLKTCRRRKDGDYVLRFVWRKRDGIDTLKVIATRRVVLNVAP